MSIGDQGLINDIDYGCFREYGVLGVESPLSGIDRNTTETENYMKNNL